MGQAHRGGNPKPSVQPGGWHHMPGVSIDYFCRQTSYQLEHHWRGEKRQDAREVTVGSCNLVYRQRLMALTRHYVKRVVECQDLMERRLKTG